MRLPYSRKADDPVVKHEEDMGQRCLGSASTCAMRVCYTTTTVLCLSLLLQYDSTMRDPQILFCPPDVSSRRGLRSISTPNMAFSRFGG